MRVLHLDPFAGASGDMLLGAFLALGVPLPLLQEAVDRVIPGEVELASVAVTRAHLAATRCEVRLRKRVPPRSLEAMKALVVGAGLPPRAREIALDALARLGSAEAAAHGMAGEVHLHELSGQDTLADVVGCGAAIAHLDPARVTCGPVNTGSGWVKTAHGLLPVPAPATAALLVGVPVVSRGPEAELTTPTGAALLSALAPAFGPRPPMTLFAAGCGAGEADHPGFPNFLRVFLGEAEEEGRGDGATGGRGEETAVMIEVGVDDVSPEYLAPLADSLHRQGAREVMLIPALGKKGRMGALLRVLAPSGSADLLLDAVLEETGSSGARFFPLGRRTLPRELVQVETPWGPVRVKRWRTPGGREVAKPEFAEVAEAARRANLPAREVRDTVMALYRARKAGPEDG